MLRLLLLAIVLGSLIFASVVYAEDVVAKRPTFTNSIGMKLVSIPTGEFQMGSPDDEPQRGANEGPQHRVRITKPFYLGMYEVTQGEYFQVMNKNPSLFKTVEELDTKRFPVELVTWEEAMEFCTKLSEIAAEKKAGRVYTLPTEAQWEYACRAGTTTPFHFGSVLNGNQANTNGNFPYGNAPKGKSLNRTTTVGSYPPNAWGLYDMHGNVSEFCSDWYDEKYYSRAEENDPQGPAGDFDKVFRGGNWIGSANTCRSARRSGGSTENRGSFWGFRVAVNPGEK
jgi:formylglycine-generating enzyme required for sulfatase activity